MAQDNTQNPAVTDQNAPIPEWLKKAQTLQAHEERGVPLVEQGQVVGPQATTLPSAIPQAVVSQGDAPLPDWLKKAGEKTVAPSFELKTKEETPQSQPELSQTPLVVMPSQTDSSLTSAISPAPESAIPVKVPASTEVTTPTLAAPPASVPSNEPALTSPTPPPKRSLFGFLKGSLTSTAKTVEKAAEKGKSILAQSKNAGAPRAVVEQAAPVELTPPSSAAPAKPLSKAEQSKATAEERKKLLEAEKIYQQGLVTIRDLISPSSMEIHYDKLRVEGLFTQTFFVYTYPRYLDTNWLSPIVNFDVTMDISQFIYPIDSAAIMAILKKKVAQMQSSVRIAAEKGIVRDPALETALEDAEELRTQIQRGQEKFFQFALYFTIYADDEKKLTKISKQLESMLGGKLILTKKSELQMEHGFNSCLPLCLDELEVARNMNTSPLSTTFPFSSSDLTSDEGILYGLNRHNDSLIIFDRFSLENANSVVFAKSGAGKSYGVKLEILRSLMLGTDVIVIDPENEYEALAQTVGGSYLRVSLTSDRRINPFDLPAPLRDEELQPGDLLRSNIINLHGLLKIMLGGVTPTEEGILDKALIDVYAVKGITMEMLDPSQVPPPTMDDLYDILSTMEGAQSLAQRLQKYTQGTYAGVFNKPTNIDMNSGLMVFSIRDLEDALRPIAMYIILNYIWNRVRSELKKRLLIIDEAWTLMQYEDSGRFLFGLVKRARKYYLGITTITQDVEDFIKSPYGKPVITNSSMQLLLKQAPSAIEVLSKVFNLTEGEKYMLLNSGVGQGLFFAGLKHVAIQIIASYSEDKIITTNPQEILQQKI
jgi:conjugal transfer ATP-binding protein TraC